ncbi:MAG: ABC transporter permease, partial [Lachnospiraceae bacterium]|nr:ABC transporter permease [Lachnospiraceae bacterium]
ISSCMNSNIAQRTQFFGMMRCIGASRRQVMRFVHLEALSWCKTAIPTGCVLSLVCTWGTCMILKYMVKGEFNDFSFRVSPIGIVCGVLVGMVTVLLAAHAPAKRAADVSPMAAVTGNAQTGRKVMRGADTRMLKVESALGVHHAVSARKNLILLTFSFALTVTLFMAFSACLDIVKKLLPSVGGFAPDVEIAGVDNTNSMDRGIREEIAAVSGVEEVLGNSIAFDIPVEINGLPRLIDLVSYDDFMFALAEKSVVSGDLSKITAGSDYALTVFNGGSRLDTGDRIGMGDTELEIACVVSEGVGGWENPLVVCTEETFTRLTGEDKYMLVNVVLEKDAAQETMLAIEELAGENSLSDRREENRDINGSYWVFRIAAGGFLTIIAMITIFHIMNSISMSVSAGMKQYGAMRAVGMSMRQMTKMIAAEALTYAVCGMAVGMTAGLLIHRLIIVKLLITHFGGTWTIPAKAVGEILLLFALSCTAAVYVPVKRLRGMAVTETISEL